MSATTKSGQIDGEVALQLDANGDFHRLLTLRGLDSVLSIDALDDAERYLTAPGSLPAKINSRAGRTMTTR